MGGRSTAYLTIALGVAAGATLWLGLWPVAALALAFLIGGHRDPVTIVADLIVFAGLASHADPLWVALLAAATAATRVHDSHAMLALLVASALATFVYVDWTILTGLLAVIATVRLARAILAVTSGGTRDDPASPRRTFHAPSRMSSRRQ